MEYKIDPPHPRKYMRDFVYGQLPADSVRTQLAQLLHIPVEELDFGIESLDTIQKYYEQWLEATRRNIEVWELMAIAKLGLQYFGYVGEAPIEVKHTAYSTYLETVLPVAVVDGATVHWAAMIIDHYVTLGSPLNLRKLHQVITADQ